MKYNEIKERIKVQNNIFFAVFMDSPNQGDGLAQSAYANDALDIKEEYAPVDEDEEESSTDDDNEGDKKSTPDMNGSEKYNDRKKHDAEVNTRPPSDTQPRKGKSNRKVPSMYDEDLYALPDEEGDTSNDPAPTLRTPPKEPMPRKKYSERKFLCIVMGIFFLAAGAGGAIYFSIFHKPTEIPEGEFL